jgi:hypothetical protein
MEVKRWLRALHLEGSRLPHDEGIKQLGT